MNDNPGIDSALNILSLEDSKMDFEIIREQLIGAGYRFKISRVEMENEFVSLIRSNKYDLILADFRLPGFDAFKALKWCGEICPEVPFICLSGAIGEETAIELLKHGAVDYIMKDKLERLSSVIDRALEEANEKTARRRAEENLLISEKKYRNLVEKALIGIYTTNLSGEMLFVNQAMCNMMEYDSVEELLKADVISTYNNKEERDKLIKKLKKSEQLLNYELELKTKYGKTRNVLVNSFLSGEIITGMMMDISDRLRAEKQIILTSKILNLLNVTTNLAETVKLTLNLIQNETGFEAAGIRLKHGDDFPYFHQNGFSDDFLLTENTLLSHSKEGMVCRDENGNPLLECTCGLVISGLTDATNNLYTEGGSYWTNDSPALFGLTAYEEKRYKPRSHCIEAGFRSIAIVPIRAKGEIVGLLQLNDHRKDCLTLELIQFIESIGEIIGVALMRKQAEEALKRKVNELQRFHNLTLDREIFMIGLKKEINELLKKSGQKEKYKIVD